MKNIVTFNGSARKNGNTSHLLDSFSTKILASDILVFATPVYFHHVTGQLIKTRLGVANQVVKSVKELEALYPKLGLSVELASEDHQNNADTLTKCFNLAKELTS